MAKDGKAANTKLTQSLSAASTRSERALAALRAAEAERSRRIKEEIEKLERNAAAERNAARKLHRQKVRQRRGFFAAKLGQLVICALERQGKTGVLLTAADLDIFAPDELAELLSLVQPDAGDEPQSATRSHPKPQAKGVDLNLDE
jgi:hypothetical protein